MVATPTDVSARLLEVGPVKRPISAYMFLVRGTAADPGRRPPTASSPGRRGLRDRPAGRGIDAVSAATGEPDLTRIFSDGEVVERHHWNPAFHLGGDALLECEQQPGLYLIGDHNVCDLEDAYLTGVYAASRIIARSA